MAHISLVVFVSLAVFGCGGGVGESPVLEEAAVEPVAVPKALLDHVILAVPDLAAGAAEFARTTGVEPIAGGVHPGLGTANMLVALSPVTYLEIAPADTASLELVIEFPGGQTAFQGEGPLDFLGG